MKLNKLLLSTALVLTLNVFESNAAAQALLIQELREDAAVAHAYKALVRTPAELQLIKEEHRILREEAARNADELERARIQVNEGNELVRALQERLKSFVPAESGSGAAGTEAPDALLKKNIMASFKRFQEENALFKVQMEDQKTHIFSFKRLIQEFGEQLQQGLQVTKRASTAMAQELMTKKTTREAELLAQIQAQEIALSRVQQALEAVVSEKEEVLATEVAARAQMEAALTGIQGSYGASYEGLYAKINELQTSLDQTNSHLEEKSKDIEKLKGQNICLQDEITKQGLELAVKGDKLASQMSTEDAERMKNLQLDLDKKEQQISKIREENASIVAKNIAALRSRLALETQLRELKQQLDQYKRNTGSLPERDTSLDASRLSASFDLSNSPFRGKKSRRGKGNPGAVDDIVGNLTRKLVDAQTYSDNLFAEKESLQRTLKKNEQKLDRIQAQLLEKTNTHERVSVMEQELQKKNIENEALKKQLIAVNTDNSRLSGERSATEQLLSDLHETIAELQRRLHTQAIREGSDKTLEGPAATTFSYSPPRAAVEGYVDELPKLKREFNANESMRYANAIELFLTAPFNSTFSVPHQDATHHDNSMVASTPVGKRWVGAEFGSPLGLKTPPYSQSSDDSDVEGGFVATFQSLPEIVLTAPNGRLIPTNEIPRTPVRSAVHGYRN